MHRGPYQELIAMFVPYPPLLLMNALIRFVASYDDLSTDKGFRFKFHCKTCRNGYMSRFQPNAIGIAGSLLQAARPFFWPYFTRCLKN